MIQLRIKVPNWVKFIAKDKSERVFYYFDKPRFNEKRGQWELGSGAEAPFSLDGPWGQSLYEVVKDDNGFITALKKYDPRCDLKADDKVTGCRVDSFDAQRRHFSHFDPDKRGIYTFLSWFTSFENEDW